MGRKKIKNADAIQFRPGQILGELLDEFAGQFGLTRSEAARRLVHLAIRGLPIELYPYVVELQTLMYETPEFGDACLELVVAVNCSKNGTEKATLSVSEMVSVAQQRIELWRTLRGIKSEEEIVKVHVYVSREK